LHTQANKPEAILSSGGSGRAPARRLDCDVQLGISGTVEHAAASVPAAQLGQTMLDLDPAQVGSEQQLPAMQPLAGHPSQAGQDGHGRDPGAARVAVGGEGAVESSGCAGKQEGGEPSAMQAAAMRLQAAGGGGGGGASSEGGGRARTWLLQGANEDEKEEGQGTEQAPVSVSLEDLVQAVREEATAVVVGSDSRSDAAEHLRALADLEQRVLRAFSGGSSAAAEGGFGALTGARTVL